MSPPPAPDITAKQNLMLLRLLPLVLAIGLGLAVWGLYLVHYQVDLALHGETATGRVIALESGTSSTGSSRPAWFPVVAFETRAGETITFRHRTGRSPPAYAVGDRVPVAYLPEAPRDALIAEGFWNWLLPLVLLTVGPGMGYLALRGIHALRRRGLSEADGCAPFTPAE